MLKFIIKLLTTRIFKKSFKIGDRVIITRKFFMKGWVGVIIQETDTYYVVSANPEDETECFGFTKKDFQKVGELTIEELLTSKCKELREIGLKRVQRNFFRRNLK
jgi:predicted ATP-grasp superfamily ATP-dependent carboligase